MPRWANYRELLGPWGLGVPVGFATNLRGHRLFLKPQTGCLRFSRCVQLLSQLDSTGPGRPPSPPERPPGQTHPGGVSCRSHCSSDHFGLRRSARHNTKGVGDGRILERGGALQRHRRGLPIRQLACQPGHPFLNIQERAALLDALPPLLCVVVQRIGPFPTARTTFFDHLERWRSRRRGSGMCDSGSGAAGSDLPTLRGTLKPLPRTRGAAHRLLRLVENVVQGVGEPR